MSAAFKASGGLLVGIGTRVLDQVSAIPAELAKIFVEDEPTGTRNIKIVIDLPEGWAECCQAEIARIERALTAGAA